MGQRAVHRGAADAEPPRDLRRAQFLFNVQPLDLGGIDRWLAPMVGAARLRGGDAFELALSPEVGFELSEHAEHVQECLARRAAGVDGLLSGFEGDASLL